MIGLEGVQHKSMVIKNRIAVISGTDTGWKTGKKTHFKQEQIYPVSYSVHRLFFDFKKWGGISRLSKGFPAGDSKNARIQTSDCRHSHLR